MSSTAKTSDHFSGCLRERVDGTATVVELHGEIDVLTAPAISERIDELTAGPCPDLVVDLRGVTFIDCRGLAVLCRARRRAAEHTGRMRLVIDSPGVLRLLRVTGLANAFEVSPVPDGPGAHTGPR